MKTSVMETYNLVTHTSEDITNFMEDSLLEKLTVTQLVTTYPTFYEM